MSIIYYNLFIANIYSTHIMCQAICQALPDCFTKPYVMAAIIGLIF